MIELGFHRFGLIIGAGLICLFAVGRASAAITNLTGQVSAELQAFIGATAGDSESAFDSFPATSDTLPLQVVATLQSLGDIPAAASAAAQFADPRDLSQPNPEEFALNVAIVSTGGSSVRYVGGATSSETRTVVFQPVDFDNAESGTAVQAIGRLYINGALALLSDELLRDLTGVEVTFQFQVVQQADGQPERVLINAEISLIGTAGGEVQVVTSGQVPPESLLITNLVIPDVEIPIFKTLILPNLELDYTYDAVIDQPFQLVATTKVTVANIENGTGAVALIGTPVDQIVEVLEATFGSSTSDKVTTALQDVRDNPVGDPVPAAITQNPTSAIFPAGLCGFLGFESLIGLTFLSAWRTRRPRSRC